MPETYKQLVEHYVNLGYSIEDAESIAELEYLEIK